MQLADFDFELPNHLIARYPLANRSASKLLRLDEAGRITHHKFTDLLNFITSKDLLLFNDTKVLAARLLGHKLTGGKAEILIERITKQNCAIAHVKSSKTCKIGMQIIIKQNDDMQTCISQKITNQINIDQAISAQNNSNQINSNQTNNNAVVATVTSRMDGLFVLEFSHAIEDILDKYGHMPLPPYLHRADEQLDNERYQTVYANKVGAVAAPTAGLHFDDKLLAQIKQRNINTAMVTLHVGSGTFAPVRVSNIKEHQMHQEWCFLSAEVAEQINACKQNGGKIIAVGTTSARTLESAVKNGKVHEFSGDTDIFFYPGGKKFQVVDLLLTNFHLPQSTLLMLVSAFAGLDNIKTAYSEAINHDYRFFSYGDAMLISKI